MSVAGPQVWLVRHGPTEWSESGRHTGRTDVELTPAGERAATALGQALAGRRFDQVLVSPLARARRTAELAGLEPAEVVPDLREWDYGKYEGLTTVEIRERVPGWTVWTHETPGGESAAEVGARADQVLARLRGTDPEAGHPDRATEVAVVAHGHFLRVLAARWLGQPPQDGRLYALGTAAVCVLGYERETPVLVRWNDLAHVPG